MNHVCLVSDQPMPNFLPILNKRLKPESVTLVVSERMRARAEWLKREIAKHQVAILDDIDIGGSAGDIAALDAKLTAWVDAHPGLVKTSVLNVTGGTKPMAIAAQEVFRMADRPVFYVDIATDTVSWVPGHMPSERLENSPTLSQLLGLNGISIVSGDFRSNVENDKWRHFCEEISHDPREWALSLGALNALASASVDAFERARGTRAEQAALRFSPGEREMELPRWNEMLEMLGADELVDGRIAGMRFVSCEAARFCAGIWLEHHVFALLKRFGFDRKRALMNARIVDSRGNENELDSVAIHRNTCYVIEDKTKNMKVRAGNQGNVADAAVYKLAQISKNLGLRTRGILVSARPVRPVDKERAKAYGVDVIDWLPDLERELERIIGC